MIFSLCYVHRTAQSWKQAFSYTFSSQYKMRLHFIHSLVLFLRDNCKISSLLKSNSEIAPLFKFFVKSVHFYCKIGPLCDEIRPILQ
jgi:hypothetical protein